MVLSRRIAGRCLLWFKRMKKLERMIDLKREKMGMFIANACTEIESLWEELIVGEDERNDFTAFADDEHTQDLLSQHEHEIAHLKAEVRFKMLLLTSIKRYMVICEEHKELERVTGDQTRLLGMSGDEIPADCSGKRSWERGPRKRSLSLSNSYCHRCLHGSKRTDELYSMLNSLLL
ncbi:microtubule associated protein-domain-containing protein [Suillus subaureus]|uniref:Microtubule associated protein-domain-containing protein n=1 Tax=Suillus subaureus TaxID=48587 RepID=A0A9P7E805_9AGAM|nr:microtubule associated protein-domain-containing protein [Suillus subaureus]KAG1813547.1 microtubule associated protein-domain-containing protein [Suillus subaureus]